MGNMKNVKEKAVETKQKLQEFYENNYNIVRGIGILLLIFGCSISIRFTVNFFAATSYTNEGIQIAKQMAIFVEFSMYLTWGVGFGIRHIKRFRMFSNVCIATSIILTILSIMASGGALYMEKGKKEQMAYTESEEYKLQKAEYYRKTKEYDSSAGSYNLAKEKYEKLFSEKDKKLQDIVDKYKDENYKRQVRAYQKKGWYKNGVDPLNRKVEGQITVEQDKYLQELNTAKADMDKKEKNKNNSDKMASEFKPDKKEITKDNNLSGYAQFYVSLVGDFGKTIDAYTYLLLAFMVQVLINILIYWIFVVIKVQYGIKPKVKSFGNDIVTADALNEMWIPDENEEIKKGWLRNFLDGFKNTGKSGGKIENESGQESDRVPEEQDKIDLSIKNSFGEVDGIKHNDIAKYLDAVFDKAVVNKFEELQSPGMNAIEEMAGLTTERVRTIKGMLEDKGVLKSFSDRGAKRTIILKKREEIGI